ncbi:MAG: putative Transposable element Tc3 transposase [Streblomastix strix]|uniref:Putative Transposable element Tc3 transposase n=1 Tax=Streblomastix strix TaxID=222440 RepID=A0A5J4WER6_9EUKA|nr:MAG: putative Transposable element Tc3 transposase [Streblomastix strix]
MVRGVALSKAARQEILDLFYKKKLSRAQILHTTRRPKETIRQVTLDKENTKIFKKRGPKLKLKQRDQRKIRRYVKQNRKTSSRKIPPALDLQCSPSTVLSCMHRMGMHKKRLRRRPLLTSRHVLARLKFAEEFLTQNQDQILELIFSDEKKFRFDGPDGWAYYWFCLGEKEDEAIYSKDYGKFKGVMCHLAISSAGILSMDRMLGKVNAESWCELLQSNILPEIHRNHGDAFIYQMDNASVHKKKEVLEFLKKIGLKFLDWPALSPDLNPVENLWALMARRVYADGMSYSNETQLWDGIQRAAASITPEEVKPFVASFRSRLCDVLKRAGRYIQ